MGSHSLQLLSDVAPPAGSAGSHRSYHDSAGYFYHPVTVGLVTTVAGWVCFGPNADGETPSHSSCWYERGPRVSTGVHRLPAPCHSAPLRCLRVRGLCQQHLKRDRKLTTSLCKLSPLCSVKLHVYWSPGPLSALGIDVIQCWPARLVG